MIKTLAQIEYIIGDNFYRIMCPANAPISEVKEALFEFSKYVGQIEDHAKAQQAAQDQQKDEGDVVDIEPEIEKAE